MSQVISPGAYIEALATDIARDPGIQNRTWGELQATRPRICDFLERRALDLFSGDEEAVKRVLSIFTEIELLQRKLDTAATMRSLCPLAVDAANLDPRYMTPQEQLATLDTLHPQEGR